MQGLRRHVLLKPPTVGEECVFLDEGLATCNSERGSKPEVIWARPHKHVAYKAIGDK